MNEPSASPRRSQLLGPAFNYANNALTLVGIVLATVSGLSIVAFAAAGLSGAVRNPYVAIVDFVVLPALLLLGLLLIPIGMWRRRRRLIAEGVSASERARYPRLDFNDPRLRRIATVILVLTAANAVIFSVTSYKAVEHMETVDFCGTSCHTVMLPESTTHREASHARVACVDCHIGPGAASFVHAKVNGVRQLWKTVAGSYERPVPTPVADLTPAHETCERCHWPAEHHGETVRVLARHASDEANTPSYTVLVLPTGGGSLELGRHGGIHWWHVAGDNRIRYLAADERREAIAWVELTTPGGEVRTYTREGEEAPSDERIAREARTMDCIDCHNRSNHPIEVPAKALDDVLQARPELVSLPFYKKQAIAAIEGDYPSHDQGIDAVREALLGFYREQHPELWSGRRELVETGAEAAARVYGRSVFPEMETDWRTHPNHIGHEDFPGCWRCHDEELATADGEHVISIDCEICHTFPVEDSERPPRLSAEVAESEEAAGEDEVADEES